MMRHRLIWPLLSIVALLLTNLLISPGFFSINMRGGHLYGSLIDIISFGAPLMLVALGMTLVIATGGIDLSVGAVAAISGACACLLISRAEDQNSLGTVLLAVAAALGLSMLCGLWNGVLVAVIGIQPFVATLILMVAGRGIAQLITTGQIITITSSPYKKIGAGYLFALPFSIFIVAIVVVVTALLTRRTALGMLIEAVGGNKEASRLAGVRSRGLIVLAYVFSGLCAGIAGLMISSIVSGADGNNAGLWIELDAILAVVIGGTALAGGRFFLAGTIVGRGADPDVDHHDLLDRDSTRDEPSLQGARGDDRVPDPVAGVPGQGVPSPARATAARERPRGRAAGEGDGMTSTTLPTRRHRIPSLIPQKYVPILMTLALLVSMFTVGSIRYPGFATGQVILNVFIDNSFLLVVAIGMTFVILTGGNRPLRRSRRRPLDAHPRPARQARLADAARDRRRARDRLGARLDDGVRHPLLRDPAVHRHARRDVPRARALLRDHRRRRLDHEARLRRGRGAHVHAAGRHVRHDSRSRLARRGPRRDLRAALHEARPQRLRDRRQRAVRSPDGAPGREDENRRLHDQRILLGARRRDALVLHAVGLRQPRRRHGARRDRSSRDRRDAC